MPQLITNLKSVKFIGNTEGLKLNKDNATTLEINAYIALLKGLITINDVVNCRYDINENTVSCYTVRKTTEVFPDYFNDHTECYLLLTLHNIVTVFNKSKSCYVSSKMKVTDEGEIINDGKHLSASTESDVLNRAGLFTLINYLESENLQKLVDLKNALSK